MARRTETITITAEGRDKGKKFILTEMSSDQGERWAERALLALTNTGAAVPPEVLSAGMAGLAAIGIQALGMVKYESVRPLLDELWPTCVRYLHKPGILPRDPNQFGDIEEVSTRWEIYKALLKLHVGFSLADVSPTSAEIQGEQTAESEGWLTSMSRALLALLFRVGLRR